MRREIIREQLKRVDVYMVEEVRWISDCSLERNRRTLLGRSEITETFRSFMGFRAQASMKFI